MDAPKSSPDFMFFLNDTFLFFFLSMRNSKNGKDLISHVFWAGLLLFWLNSSWNSSRFSWSCGCFFIDFTAVQCFRIVGRKNYSTKHVLFLMPFNFLSTLTEGKQKQIRFKLKCNIK